MGAPPTRGISSAAFAASAGGTSVKGILVPGPQINRERLRERYFALLDAFPDWPSDDLHVVAQEDEERDALAEWIRERFPDLDLGPK